MKIIFCLLPLATALLLSIARADDTTPATFNGASPTPVVHPCPLPYGKWVPIPELSDEFDGTTLDTSKWYPYNPKWDGPEPDYYNPKNVRVQDGNMCLDAKFETLTNVPPKYHTYTTAAVQSKAKVRYGYFEVRAKAMDTQVSSDFWFYDTTPEQWTEIDVFEVNGRQIPFLYHMTLHVFYTLVEKDRWQSGEKWIAPFNFSHEFHTYGLEWNPDEIIWWVDGQVRRRAKNTHWHQPLAMQFDSDVKPSWFGLPDKDSLPATFRVDYVRSWKRLDGPPDTRPLAIEFRFPGRKADPAVKESIYRLKTDGGGTYVVHATGGDERPQHVFTEYEDPAYFAAQTEPEITKAITLQDTSGKNLVLDISWKKNTGLAALFANQPANAATNGYTPCGIDVPAATTVQRPSGAVDDYLLTDENGSPVKVTVIWP